MSYRDPYAERYTDTPAGFTSFNNAQPHKPYDQGGYDPYPQREDGNYANPGGSAVPPNKSEYNQAAFAQATTGPGSRPRDLRRWRREHHGGLWTRGSRVACFGRFCCCTLMIAVFLIVSIVVPLALWTRPPTVVVGNIQGTSNGSEVQVLTNGVQFNLQVPIYVTNPNIFSVSFSSINANIYYPINNTLIGQGQLSDVTFHSHSATNLTFPFDVEYTTNMTSSAEIISSLLTSCGFVGGTTSDITVNYDITLHLRVIFFTVSPTVSDSASFACPLTESDITGLAAALL